MTRPRTHLWLVLVLALGGCDWGLGSDPGHPPCAAGHLREADGCRVAAAMVTIDGLTGDWDGVEEIALAPVCTLAPCDGLLAVSLQVAVEPCVAESCVPRVFFRVRLAGGAAPVIDDPDLRFVLQLAPTIWRPAAETDTLRAGTFGASFDKNGHDVGPPVGTPPYQLAWTADGYEAAIPADYLPLRGAALVSPFVERRVGAAFASVSDPPPARAICWEAYPELRDPCDVLAAEEAAR